MNSNLPIAIAIANALNKDSTPLPSPPITIVQQAHELSTADTNVLSTIDVNALVIAFLITSAIVAIIVIFCNIFNIFD